MAETRYIFVDQPDIAWSITVPRGMRIPVTCELLGGAGGGGGADASKQGGAGAGGQYSKFVFDVVGGDVLTFIVGGGGGAGSSNTRGGGGGAAGTSMIKYNTVIFNLKNPVGGGKVYRQTNAAWNSFMNENAVWESNSNAATFTRTYTVNFPKDGNYTYKLSSDNTASIFIDGILKGRAGSYTKEYTYTEYVTAGTRQVSINAENTGGPGGVAFEILRSVGAGDFQGSMSGGRGGNAGGSGSSGGGGGGGGASALLLNGDVVAVAGGGGGGGGAGVGSNGHTATNTPNTSSDYFNGQSGQPKRGDGGGGGASGGGWHAGDGGTEVGGDSGGNAGESADGYFTIDPYTQNEIVLATGRDAYGTVAYGRGGAAGQAGQSGYVRFSFETTFASYKLANQWKDVETVYVKDAGVWKEAAPYIKRNGEWQALARREIGRYQLGVGIVGADYRDLAIIPEPVYTYSGGSSYEYWSYPYNDFDDYATGGVFSTSDSGGGTTFGGTDANSPMP